MPIAAATRAPLQPTDLFIVVNLGPFNQILKARDMKHKSTLQTFPRHKLYDKKEMFCLLLMFPNILQFSNGTSLPSSFSIRRNSSIHTPLKLTDRVPPAEEIPKVYLSLSYLR